MSLTPESLAAVAASALSLVFLFIPPLRKWFDPLPSENKAAIMAGLVVAVAAAAFWASCQGWNVLGFTLECTQASAENVIKVLFATLMANQGTWLVARNWAPKSA